MYGCHVSYESEVRAWGQPEFSKRTGTFLKGYIAFLVTAAVRCNSNDCSMPNSPKCHNLSLLSAPENAWETICEVNSGDFPELVVMLPGSQGGQCDQLVC